MLLGSVSLKGKGAVLDEFPPTLSPCLERVCASRHRSNSLTLSGPAREAPYTAYGLECGL